MIAEPSSSRRMLAAEACWPRSGRSAWSQVTARADGASAGDVRHEPTVQAREQELDGLDARTGIALRERVRAQQHRGAHDLVGVRLAHAARMTAEQSQLQLARLLGRD